jgi:hypothetical protein
LEVEVPSKSIDPSQISWHNKIEESVACWHTVGHDPLEYTPESLLKRLDKCRDDLRKGNIITDVELNEDELSKHIELIHRLAACRTQKATSGFAETGTGQKVAEQRTGA